MARFAIAALATATIVLCGSADAQDTGTPDKAIGGEGPGIQRSFQERVRPLLTKYCLRCHNAKRMKSGIRVDRLTGALEDRELRLLENIRKQLADEAMPPEDEPQPTAAQRRLVTDWIGDAMAVARARQQEKNGSVRRLTVSQYRNTLRDLLGLEDDLTDGLPPDAVSKDGFVNNGQTMLLSPLLVEAYFDMAEKALDLCIVGEDSKPVVQNFRVDLGAAINPHPCPDKLILGANSRLLKNEDFVVTQLTPVKPFDFEPFLMRTKYRFIEGYKGNDTVRGWREYDSIYHAVFAGMRGNDGYPKGEAYETVREGLLLRPAIPSAELFGVESTYGPKANFKISLRELPDYGRFRVTIRAARYDDGLLLDPGTEAQVELAGDAIKVEELTEPQTVHFEKAGLYQVDVYSGPSSSGKSPSARPRSRKPRSKKPPRLSLKLGDRLFSGVLRQPAFLAVRLPAGPLTVTARLDGDSTLRRIVFTPLESAQETTRRFEKFEKRSPRIGVYVGLRRDCGSTLSPVGAPRTVSSTEPKDFVFEGAINNFPSPHVEKDNVNYLAGVREIGVRSEYTDGRDMPRLLIRSVEFEGPLYETWPPAGHRNIFINSDHKDDQAAYAHDVIRTFATRAFRRPISDAEMSSLFGVWEDSFAEIGDFHQSVKDALLVVLTSPQFLFLIENSESPEPERLDPYELASKLSYFLWNAAPDDQLLKLAAANTLYDSLDAEIDRMIRDPGFQQFASEFTSQWLSLDKLDVVEVDRKRYPRLTRDTKTELRKEPVHFLLHLIRHNLPLRDFIQSDFIVANEVTASYYGLGDRTESGFEFVSIRHEKENLGGVLSQAGILAGLSNGRESNPIKRGAWLARKIIAEPPDDPPPNVPALPEDDGTHLTLREKLARHRDQPGCANCHSGIDPWGFPLEQFDAGGLFKSDQAVEARTTLPDDTEIADSNGLKTYLANDRIDRVAFSFLKHLTSYATGRSLGYSEMELLEKKGLELKSDGYGMQDMIQFVIKSELFLEK